MDNRQRSNAVVWLAVGLSFVLGAAALALMVLALGDA